MTPEVLRAWSWRRQGLDGALRGATARDVLARAGWTRTVGGHGPYLALAARSGAARAAIDAELAAADIHELPCVRGCTYLVPRDDYAVALAAGAAFAGAELATAKKHTDVTDAEIARLCERVLDALAGGPLDPKAIRDRVGDAARSLGEAAKKKGLTTTLPIALGLLQARGAIRRIPTHGGIDGQRYAYALWPDNPLRGVTFTAADVAVELARRFYRWAGPATPAQLAWWTGLSKKDARAATAAVGAAPIAPDDERVVLPDDLEPLRECRPPEAPAVSLVGSIDNLVHLRRELSPAVADADRGHPLLAAGIRLFDLPHHAIVDRGRLVGLWDYDPAERRVIYATFSPADHAVREGVARTEAYVRDELGDARSYSLDAPGSRGPRLAALRGAARA